MDVGFPGCCNDVLHGDLLAVVSIGNIVSQRSVEEDWLLGDNTQLGPDPGHIQGLDVMVLKGEHPRAEVIEPLDQLDHCRLATT